jgi:anaerobic sulfite reductase subunit C
VIEETGCSVLVGGTLGRHPRLARELTGFATEEELMSGLDVAIEVFTRDVAEGERMADAVTRIGPDELVRRLKERAT